LGLKQLQPHPWDAVAEKYKTGERVRGTVTRLMEFGAFVELAPGIEGLIHLSEMSWAKKVRKPGDVVNPGDTVDAVILAVNAAERRISLGLKQALGDPWADVEKNLALGSQVEGPVTSMTKFGAFVQISEGVEGMIHISEITAEKHLHHPQEVLRLGQVVQAQVIAVDTAKRQLRLSMKQLVPTNFDTFLAEQNVGDVVSGRIIENLGQRARVELGERIEATCSIPAAVAAQDENKPEGKVDLSAFSSMLKARWKGGDTGVVAKPDAVRAGQIRSFKITKLDKDAKTVELELAQ
jgi:small subunit ribosomal protein S1